VKATQDEAILKRIRTICLALPEACEIEAWGHPTFRAGKKMFAACGGKPGEMTLGMKMSFARQDELLEDDRFFPTPYAARQGWVSLRLDAKTDWKEIAELLREAYRQVALKRMVKALDGDDV
jgi:predicted DNA-binding protein (MmcQ/YjbR family)